jgi:hypothetical protein
MGIALMPSSLHAAVVQKGLAALKQAAPMCVRLKRAWGACSGRQRDLADGWRWLDSTLQTGATLCQLILMAIARDLPRLESTLEKD